MRLTRFLNERDEKVFKAVEPFLKEFGIQYMHDNVIYRGASSVSTSSYTVKNVRKDRKPRFIPEELHKFLGKVSKDLGGGNMRTEGVFTGGSNTAKMFSNNVFIFLPMGKYKYVWADNKTTRTVYSLYDEYQLGDIESLSSKTIEDELKSLYENKYREEGLSKHLNRISRLSFEAIFNCDKYILVNPGFWDKFKEKVELI